MFQALDPAKRGRSATQQSSTVAAVTERRNAAILSPHSIDLGCNVSLNEDNGAKNVANARVHATTTEGLRWKPSTYSRKTFVNQPLTQE